MAKAAKPKMKHVLINTKEQVQSIHDTLLSTKTFTKRELPGGGYEIFPTILPQRIVFRLKQTGPPKFRRWQMDYEDGLVDFK